MLRALVQVVAVKSDGATSPASAPASFTTSPAAAPTLTNVQATSPTTGTATAVPPPGITYISYTFTVVPLNGGAPITVTSSSAAGAIPGLTPGTQARHCSVPALVSVCAEQLASKHSRQHSLCTPSSSPPPLPPSPPPPSPPPASAPLPPSPPPSRCVVQPAFESAAGDVESNAPQLLDSAGTLYKRPKAPAPILLNCRSPSPPPPNLPPSSPPPLSHRPDG